MPWRAREATQHTHLASTPKKKRLWARIANQQLEEHGDDARAIRVANAAVSGIKKAKDELKELMRRAAGE